MTNGKRTGLALLFFGLGAAQGCGFFDSAYVPGVDDPIDDSDGDGGDAPASTLTFYASGAQQLQKVPFGDVSTICGDGLLGHDEACDDGGVEDGDGCNAGCLVESGSAGEAS